MQLFNYILNPSRRQYGKSEENHIMPKELELIIVWTFVRAYARDGILSLSIRMPVPTSPTVSTGECLHSNGDHGKPLKLGSSAMDDIRVSIAELQYYRHHIFKVPSEM